MFRCIFHVDLDAFFVSVEVLHDPSLKGKPVVVGGNPDSRGVVSAASYEVRKYGVHSAMPLSQARRLCPQAVFVPLHFRLYVDASRAFMALLETVSTVIEPMGIDEAYLDVSSLADDFDSARALAAQLKARVRDELGLVASIGVASCKIVAKVASDQNKPDGLVVVRPGEEADFLAPLPIGKLPGIGKKTGESLHNIGVETLGQLAALPDDILRSAFGRYGEILRRHSQGIDNSRVESRGEPKSMSRETTFDVDTRDMEFLRIALRSMSEQLSRDLIRHSKQASTVTVKLRWEDFETVNRQESLKVQSSTVPELYEAANRLLLHLISGGDKRVRLIGLKVSNLAGPERQLDMFAPET
ncbi:MAG: DNA polymerase IV, partial [Dehalococcoidia bacterium]|nr:DNA polymerase IV [Dehalococcoidia bacterium]